MTPEEKQPAAPAAQAAPAARFLQRLPQLVTFFFSLTLVNGFVNLANSLEFRTHPVLDLADPARALLLLSFFVTLFWIVTAWMGYSLLIERYPYTLDFSRFFFDVARFSVMFAQLNFAFLVNTVDSYHIFIFGMAFFHLLLLGWYIWRILGTRDAGRRREWSGDARSHGRAGVVYLLLGILYYLGVASAPQGRVSGALRYAVVAATLLFIVGWSVRRLSELRKHALEAEK